MKVFRVIIERDGKTRKVDGVKTTEIDRAEYRFAAETMEEVWEEILWIRDDVEKTLIAIVEEAPAITILTPNAQVTGDSPVFMAKRPVD